ncbi:hypothetical protein MBLNU230_g2451t1 [Neophaeotheca triangularis]
MAKPKQFTKPPKKEKAKAKVPETADDFQEAADVEEETGGKWRAGDPAKSGRAFMRALEIYDNGVQKHPENFDLAYNKARLELEITQQPIIVDHVGLSLADLLNDALQSHRYAMKLNEDNVDVLFNTSQVLLSMAEFAAETDETDDAVAALHEALEILSSCLSRQELLLEQQRQQWQDNEDGGVALNPDSEAAVSKAASSSTSTKSGAEQAVTIEHAVQPSDLLDTVEASLSALTQLAGMSDSQGLQTLGGMAQDLTEKKAPSYIALLPSEEQDQARAGMALSRAKFVSGYGDAQYNMDMIDLESYVESLSAFELPSKTAASMEAEATAKIELVLSALDRYQESPDSPAGICWQQATQAGELIANTVSTELTDAVDKDADHYKRRGDAELLRFRIAFSRSSNVPEPARKSVKTLLTNAEKYYEGAFKHAKAKREEDLAAQMQQRAVIAGWCKHCLSGPTPEKSYPKSRLPASSLANLAAELDDLGVEGFLDATTISEMQEGLN